MAYWHTGVLKVIRLYDMKKTWIMLTSNSVKVDKSNSKGLSKEFIKDLYQRDCIAKEIFKNNTNKPVTVENLKLVLSNFSGGRTTILR